MKSSSSCSSGCSSPAAAASRLVYGAVWVLLYARLMDQVVGFDRRALALIYAKSAAATLAALVPLVAVRQEWPQVLIGASVRLRLALRLREW